MALFRLQLRYSPNSSELATFVIADNADAASKVIEERGYGHILPALSVEEVPNPKAIPYLVFNEFVGKFYAGEFPQQRFGQAFLNTFAKVYPLVEAHHYGGYLWEEKVTNVALDKINDLGLIDFTV